MLEINLSLEKKQGIELFLEIGGELNRREYKLGVQEGGEGLQDLSNLNI